MILDDTSKRACIYFIYSRDGIVDDYIIYQLKDVKKNVEFLLCVINGSITCGGKAALNSIADEVYIRENTGNDIGAYKSAIKHMGWEYLKAYDELILMNFTCFGPIYPFFELFNWANCQNVDFWGLTWDKKANWLGTNNYLHFNNNKKHFQSNFLALRKPLLGSDLLKNFFSEIPDDTSYVESGLYYEYAFPGYFEEHGYKGAVYCDTNDDYNYPLLFNPLRMIKEFRMPLFKVRNFFHHYTDVISQSAGEALPRLLRFIDEETDYDINLVWKAMLRERSLSDIMRCAQLNRVLPRDTVVCPSQKRSQKVGLVYHAFYESLFDEDILYIGNFPSDASVLITTDTERKKKLLEEKLINSGVDGVVKIIGNRGRDIASLLVGAADFVPNYDLICFAHDKKSTQIHPSSIGRSWSCKLSENTFGSKEFVLNVIDLFRDEKSLGIAFPSPPNHSTYANSIGSGWTGNYENSRLLMSSLNIDVPTNEHTLCVAPLGTCFWFRPDALKKLFAGINNKKWSYEDFPREPNRIDHTILHAIERIFAYTAQDAGYYPVYLYNDKWSQIELTNLEFEKTGSESMRFWVDALAADSIGYRTVDESLKMQQTDSNTGVINHDINIGIRESLLYLADALRIRFPRVWRIILPVRRLAQKLLSIKTRGE